MLTDIRYALRLWIHRPGFALTAVLILALGIGATTAVFSVVDAVLLRPLTWPDADRLVTIHAVWPERRNDPTFRTGYEGPKTPSAWNRAPVSWQLWEALKASPAFDDVAIWHYSVRPYSSLDDKRSELVDTIRTSSSFFSLLGLRPLHGRLFTDNEDHDINVDTIVFSYEGWQKHFGGRSDVIGKPVTLFPMPTGRGRTWTIVGVLQPGFQYQGLTPEVFFPFGQVVPSYVYETNRSLRAFGRLAPGVSLEAATTVAESATPSPTSFTSRSAPERRSTRLVRLTDEAADSTIPSGVAVRPLWLMLAGAVLLLLLACSNVAGLLLGEIRARRHEIAVRTALGGSRQRVLRQLAVENLMLAIAGSIAGLVLAGWLTPIVVAMAPDRLANLADVQVNLRLAAFSVGLGMLTTALFGIVPVAALLSTRAGEALSENAREATPRTRKGQRIVVACQFGLALVLLVSASLFGETILRLRSQPLGFDPGGLALVNLRLPDRSGEIPMDQATKAAMRSSPELGRQEAERRRNSGWIQTAAVIERVSALPGVTAVAGVFNAPFSGSWSNASIRPYGQPLASELTVQRQFVTERYFETMGMSILQGRGFEASDREAGSAAIVSIEFARRVFEGDAIGKVFVEGSLEYHVIGIVPNAKQREVSEDDSATFFLLHRAFGSVNQLVIRTSGRTQADAARMLPLIRRSIQDYDKQMVVTSFTTMEDRLATSLAEHRFRATLSGVFSGIALFLAATGLYGLAARRAAERRREIGVRVSLGATPQDVRALVMREAWVVVGLGGLWGLPAAYALSQLTRSFLFGVSATAPHVFLISAVTLAAVALAATFVPAYRASRVDPVLALRS